MEQLINTYPILVAVLSGVVGLLLGVGLMMLLQRRQAGGRSVEELRQEMDEYRDKVSDHFATTSELFRDMTEKYRDVYNHLAASSQALCEDPMQHGRLEFTETAALTEDDLDSVDAVDSVDAADSVNEAPVGPQEEADEVPINPTDFGTRST